jgi:hypothetical protein
MTQSDLDIFDGLATAETSTDDVSVTDQANADATSETAADTSEQTSDQEESPVETFAEVPEGTMAITEFASYMTQLLMRKRFEAGEELDGSEYVVPQSVYQTVKAQRDRIPHVIVKGPEDKEGRVYVKKDEATEWWLNRRDRLATRGTGAKAASSRTPEENLTLLSVAVGKALYAKSRQTMWTQRVEQSDNLVEKYKGFLSDANVSEDTITLTVQEATDAFNAEQAEKAKEKASKKSAKTDEE